MKTQALKLLVVVTVCLAIAAGCAAPTATPEPPTPTPVPPAAAAPDQLAVIQAWADAIYRGDVDAALSYFTDDGKYLVGEPAYGKDRMRQVFTWLAGLETKWEFLECLPDGDSITCSTIVLDGCRAASGPTGLPVKATFTLQDGKIKSVKGSTAGPEWNDYWSFFGAVRSWASDNRAREFASLKYFEDDGYRNEAGAVLVKLCREYAAAPAEATSSTPDAQSGLPAARPIPIIWDDDGSIDGVIALLYLLRHPAFDIKAATVSPGIAHPAIFAPNLARLLALLGVEGVPIAAGPEQPLAGDNAFPAAWRTASDKFWDLELPEAASPVDKRTAAALIVSVIKNSEEPVTIFVSGSLTNLAQALRDDPSIKDGIRSVEIMGGAVKSAGNVGSVPAEWNIYIDPVAAEEVFASGVPIRLTPLDATDQIPWMESDAAAWEASAAPASSVAARFLRRTMSDWSSSSILIWDLVAAVNAAHPEFCQWQDMHLTVAQPGAANEGQTVLVADQAPNVKACLMPDADAYHDAATEVFAAAP